MDQDLKTLLQQKADEVRPDPRIPGPVLRRSRRRRAVTGVAAGVVAIGAVAGLFAGARFLVRETGGEPRKIRPAGTPAALYPYIYPPNAEELDRLLAKVQQGSFLPPSTYGTALLFAMNVLDWQEEDIEVDVRGDDPITAIITNPALNESAGATADVRTAVFLAQVPGSQDPPVYAVLAARAEDMDVEPVGPDQELGADGVVAFQGQVGFVPPAGTVALTLEGDEGSASGASTVIQPDGRFEVEAQLPHPLRPNTLLSLALVDGSGRTLAVTSSRLSTPVAGEAEAGASAPVQVGPPREIPPAVLDTRQAILDAAQAGDWNALRALIPRSGFTFSFGGERDPIRYWRQLESEGHVPLLGDILPAVLGTEPSLSRGVFIWPAQAAEDPSRWDERDLEVLRQIHAEEDIRLFQEIGLYTGWRAGIDREGTWIFFVAGD